MQDTNVFAPLTNSVNNRIIINEPQGLIHINLASYLMQATISPFNDYQPVSGVKPSKDIELGAVGYHVASGDMYTYTWLTTGEIARNQVGVKGHVILMQPVTIPIPSDVTFQ